MYYFEKVAAWNAEIRSCYHFLVSEFIRFFFVLLGGQIIVWFEHVTSNIFYLYWKYLYLYSGVKIKIVTDKPIILNKYQL